MWSNDLSTVFCMYCTGSFLDGFKLLNNFVATNAINNNSGKLNNRAKGSYKVCRMSRNR